MMKTVNEYLGEVVVGLLVAILGAIAVGGYTVTQDVAVLKQQVGDLTVAVNKSTDAQDRRILVLENSPYRRYK